MSSKLQIDFKEYLDRLSLNAGTFKDLLRLPMVESVQEVVSLREIGEARCVMPMSKHMMHLILRSVRTLDGQKPFESATFEMQKMGIRQVKIGQRFAYRENYVKILENISDILCRDHAINSGMLELGAYVIFGKDSLGKEAIAFYLPPIIEEHAGFFVIMDGIHRDFIALKMGQPIFAIVASGVSVPFPCEPHSWDDLKVIPQTEKPANLADRYFGLRKELFRDLKFFGIDG